MAITIKQLNSKINALGKRTAKWRDDVQIVLTQCAQLAFDFNNVDPCTRLVGVLKGADSKAIIHWIEAHMPAVWMKSEEKFRFNKSFEGQYDALALMADPWWELATKPKNISSSIDVLDSVRDLIKRMEREITAGKKAVEHKELVGDLKALAGRYAQAEVEAPATA